MHSDRRYKRTSSIISERRRKKRAFTRVLKTLLTAALLVGLFFFFRADFLQVKSFEIVGADTLPQANLKAAASSSISGYKFFVIPKSNIIFLSKKSLASAILSDFSRIEKVNVSKQFFSDTIKLEITERKPEFLWCNNDSCYYMNGSGLIFEKAFDEPIDGFVVFRGRLSQEPLLKNFATTEEMQRYLKIIKLFKNSNIEVSEINIEMPDKASAETNLGQIIFDPEETDISSVVENVVLLIEEVRSKNPSAKFQYIDARFGNKMFYKLI